MEVGNALRRLLLSTHVAEGTKPVPGQLRIEARTDGTLVAVGEDGVERIFSPRPQDWAIPTGAIAQTVDRSTSINNDSALLTSGRLHLYAIYLRAQQLVSNITFVSAVTAAGTPTNQWFSLYSSALAKLGVTADDTTTAWAANTAKTKAMATPYRVLTSGLYYLGITVVATTVPTLRSSAGSVGVLGIAPILAGQSTTGLTNPASAPSTAAALTAQSNIPYAYVS